MRYRIKNWREFQHYKDRCPPWIKFHTNTFTSKDWIMLADASRLHMIVCMVLASADKAGDGSFDGDPDFVKRMAYLDTLPDLTPLVKCGFIEECKQMLADASVSKHDEDSACCSLSVSASAMKGGVGENKKSTDNVFQDLPSEFNSVDFREQWLAWEEYLKAVHHRPMQPMQRGPAFVELLKGCRSAANAMSAIRKAIANGWKSIHPLNPEELRPYQTLPTPDEVERQQFNQKIPTRQELKERDAKRQATAAQ